MRAARSEYDAPWQRMPAILDHNVLPDLRGPSPDRVGKHQRRVRQALIALEVATTRQLFEYVWPQLLGSFCQNLILIAGLIDLS